MYTCLGQFAFGCLVVMSLATLNLLLYVLSASYSDPIIVSPGKVG